MGTGRSRRGVIRTDSLTERVCPSPEAKWIRENEGPDVRTPSGEGVAPTAHDRQIVTLSRGGGMDRARARIQGSLRKAGVRLAPVTPPGRSAGRDWLAAAEFPSAVRHGAQRRLLLLVVQWLAVAGVAVWKSSLGNVSLGLGVLGFLLLAEGGNTYLLRGIATVALVCGLYVEGAAWSALLVVGLLVGRVVLVQWSARGTIVVTAGRGASVLELVQDALDRLAAQVDRLPDGRYWHVVLAAPVRRLHWRVAVLQEKDTRLRAARREEGRHAAAPTGSARREIFDRGQRRDAALHQELRGCLGALTDLVATVEEHLATLELDRVPQKDVPTASRPRVGRITEGHDVAAVDDARERLMLMAESYRALAT